MLSFLAVHGGLVLRGLGVPEAQAAGWLLDPLPAGPLLRPPALGGIAALDPAILLALLPRIVTEITVAVVIQILYVLRVEREVRQDLDIDGTFLATGAANLVGGLLGSIPLAVGRTPTMVLHNAGAGDRLGSAFVLAILAALLLLGAGPLALLPRPLAGGALVGIGLGLVALLAGACRTISGWEIGIACTVCIATAALGAAPGFLVGITVALLIFAVQYAQIPAVRRGMSGAERPSSVIRGPEAARVLREAGRRTQIYTLQGYLFFLNAQTISRRVAACDGELRFLILDFRDCVGLDSSALLAFRKIAQVAERRGFDILLVQLDAAGLRQVTRSGLANQGRIRVLDTLDEGLRHAEATLLAESDVAAGSGGASFAVRVAAGPGGPIDPADLAPYLAPRTFAPSETLMRQGEEAAAMYFVESGLVSIELEIAGRPNLRLRTAAAGTIIGKIALVQDGRRSATAVAESACRVVGIDREALVRMERKRPDLALRLQRFLIRELAGKVVNTNRLLEVELR